MRACERVACVCVRSQLFVDIGCSPAHTPNQEFEAFLSPHAFLHGDGDLTALSRRLNHVVMVIILSRCQRYVLALSWRVWVVSDQGEPRVFYVPWLGASHCVAITIRFEPVILDLPTPGEKSPGRKETFL